MKHRRPSDPTDPGGSAHIAPRQPLTSADMIRISRDHKSSALTVHFQGDGRGLTNFTKLKGRVELVSGCQQENGVVDPRVQRWLGLKAPFKPDTRRQKMIPTNSPRNPKNPSHTRTHTLSSSPLTKQENLPLFKEQSGAAAHANTVKGSSQVLTVE